MNKSIAAVNTTAFSKLGQKFAAKVVVNAT